jgi:hypothetical protein
MAREHTNSIEDRALALLGAGIAAEAVASALGVTASYISQLLSNDEFAEEVTLLRYENLQKHNRRDSSYDTLEDKLLEKLEKALPLMYKPGEVLKALQIVNGAKRRGQSAPEQVTNQQNIVNLILPTVVLEQFATNINNQVIKVGDQELLTLPSNQLLESTENADNDPEPNKIATEAGGV